MFKNIYKCKSHVCSPTTGPRPSGVRWKSSIDVTVVVELACRIQDLVQNESGELLAHGVDPISRVTFIPHLRHLSFRKKGLTSCALVQL